MKFIITRIARLLGRRASVASLPVAVRDERETARGLAAAIDRAMTLGLWDHAARVAQTAGRLTGQHPNLAERIARLRLAEQNPEAALTVIDSCAARSASLRMLRAICLLHLGRRMEAHLDLNQWSHRAAAPLQARLLLALLEWRGGDIDAAIAALLRNLRHMEDPRTLSTLLLICVASGRRTQALIWADRVREARASACDAPELDLVLRSMNFAAPRSAAIEPSEAHIDRLASELIEQENAIAPLVEVQRLSVDPATAATLRRAIERALPQLEDQPAACQALAVLSMLLGQDDAAKSWARRGLREQPVTASLLRLVECAADSGESLPAVAADVLATIGENGTRITPSRRERAA